MGLQAPLSHVTKKPNQKQKEVKQVTVHKQRHPHLELEPIRGPGHIAVFCSLIG